MEIISRRRLRLVGLSVGALLLISGCTSEGIEAPVPAKQELINGPNSGESDIELPEGVTAQGVILAAYLLTSGDIARAVEEALVSPEEVELARKAIEEDSLQEWVSRASKEIE